MLESPFNNIYDAAMEHPFSVLFRYLWWFDNVFLEAMETYGIYLQTDEQWVCKELYYKCHLLFYVFLSKIAT